MAPSSATRNAKALPTRRTRKAWASENSEAEPPTSDGEEENGTQSIKVEDEKVAEEIKITASKLEELKDPNAALGHTSRKFLQTIAEDKARITTRLEEVGAGIRDEKASYEEQMTALLSTALAPIVLGTTPTDFKKPLHIGPIHLGGRYFNEQSTRLLEECKVLLKEFKELDVCESDDSPVDKLIVRFNADRDYTERLFAAGRKVGQSKIEDMLADARNAVRKRRLESKEEEEFGQSVFRLADASREDEDVIMEDCEGWGNVAYKASHAAHKMGDVMVRE